MFSLRWPLEVWILLCGPLVVVPLGLSLRSRAGISTIEQRLWQVTKWLQWPAAIAFVVAFAFAEQSYLAAAFTLPWLVTTLLLALVGLLRLQRNGWQLNGQTAASAALIFLPVGAGWAVLSRAGIRPQDFSHAIVLLTAVHFHYAGFALPILTSRVIGERPGWLEKVLVAAVVVGVPAVGVGISLSPTIEVAAAIALTIACLGIASLQLSYAWRIRDRNASPLLFVSAASLLTAMALAATYAVGEFLGQPWLPIPAMIATHGVLNAFGFAICGLAGHALNRPAYLLVTP